MQRCGVVEVSNALESEEVSLVLFLKGSPDTEAQRLREMAEGMGIPVLEAGLPLFFLKTKKKNYLVEKNSQLITEWN